MQIIIDGKKKKQVEGGGIIDLANHMSGPKESYIGSGPGVTERIGPNAPAMINAMLHPKFIEEAYAGEPLEYMKEFRNALRDNGNVGRYSGEGKALGMTRGGEMQFFARMPLSLFQTLMWTDPTLFEDEKRLEAYLIRSGLAVVAPSDY